MNLLYRLAGLASLGLAIAGVFLPLLPTVPFLLLAAFLFGRGSPAWERRLIAHPRLGPPILAWRERGAIGRKSKLAALAAFIVSATFGLLLLDPPWSYMPAAVAIICGTWIATRPEQ